MYIQGSIMYNMKERISDTLKVHQYSGIQPLQLQCDLFYLFKLLYQAKIIFLIQLYHILLAILSPRAVCSNIANLLFIVIILIIIINMTTFIYIYIYAASSHTLISRLVASVNANKSFLYSKGENRSTVLPGSSHYMWIHIATESGNLSYNNYSDS